MYMFHIFAIIWFIGAIASSGKKILTKQELIKQLLINNSNYDSNISPDFELDQSTNVTVQLFITNVDSMDELSMDFSLDCFLRQKWFDKRLVHDPVDNRTQRLELDSKVMQNVWVPDAYFSNEKTARFHDVTIPNRLMHIYPDGTVFYSVRISMTLSCAMDLSAYPFDEQSCPIHLESYSYSTENVVFQWHEKAAITYPDLALPQFTMAEDATLKDGCIRDYGTDGKFSCLSATLHFSRNIGYYVAQIFVPSILIVMLSWVSFWVDPSATPARITVGVLTVLIITTQGTGVRSELPRVSYVKAIDVWMAACLLFVFAALLEFAYINIIKGINVPTPVKTDEIQEANSVKTDTNDRKKEDQKARDDKALKVDHASRIIFPSLFLIYNLIFWIYYG